MCIVHDLSVIHVCIYIFCDTAVSPVKTICYCDNCNNSGKIYLHTYNDDNNGNDDVKHTLFEHNSNR